eukprot:TRINITY_DN2430_c0_g1_i1.p1 TRINITY_DN2430_c0_g1~~TRINITY_DN2430_c0_g1_i1.p1  ORF type:complete len:224 (-),score=88.14 TRINITY_DN2430_c0_g1_i1:20-691(-)
MKSELKAIFSFGPNSKKKNSKQSPTTKSKPLTKKTSTSSPIPPPIPNRSTQPNKPKKLELKMAVLEEKDNNKQLFLQTSKSLAESLQSLANETGNIELQYGENVENLNIEENIYSREDDSNENREEDDLDDLDELLDDLENVNPNENENENKNKNENENDCENENENVNFHVEEDKKHKLEMLDINLNESLKLYNDNNKKKNMNNDSLENINDDKEIKEIYSN